MRHKHRCFYETEVIRIQKEFNDFFDYFYKEIYDNELELSIDTFSNHYCYYQSLLKDLFDCIQELAIKKQSNRIVWNYTRNDLKKGIGDRDEKRY